MASPANRDQEKNSPDALADELERDAERLEERSDKLAGEIEDTRRDWESKKSDPGVPGAVEERRPSDSDDESGESPAAGKGSPV